LCKLDFVVVVYLNIQFIRFLLYVDAWWQTHDWRLVVYAWFDLC